MESAIPAARASQRQIEFWGAALILLASIPIFAFDLGSYGLVNGDEAFYHEVARNMLESGNWLRIEFAGELRGYDTFTHAPLFPWLKALVMPILGYDYWSMRAVSAVFAALTALVVYAFGLRLMGIGPALLAALMHLTTYQFVFLHSGRTGEMEPLIACLILLSPLMLARAFERRSSFIPSHLCVIALLCLKAPIALIPLAATALFFAVSSPHRDRLRDWLRDGLWLLPLAVAWHAYQLAVGWDLFLETLDTLERMTVSHRGLLERIRINSSFYLETLAWGGFPYSLVYPAAMAVFAFPGGPREDRHSWWLLGCYALTICVFFALIRQHHAWYITPLYGFLALAVARWFSGLAAGALPRVSVALGVGFLSLVPWMRLEWFGFHPFEQPAINVNPMIQWVGWQGLPAWLFVTLTFIAVSAIAWWRVTVAGESARNGRIGHQFSIVLAVALVAFGTTRVLSSLVHTDHVSQFEQFARNLDARASSGTPLTYPVKLPSVGKFVANFFFYRDHKVVQTGARRFKLVGPRDPNDDLPQGSKF